MAKQQQAVQQQPLSTSAFQFAEAQQIGTVVKEIKEYDGRVRIKKHGARLIWETLLIPQVPNLCVLLALTQHITGGQKP